MTDEELSRLWDDYQEERNAVKQAETDRLASEHPAEWGEFRRVAPLLDLAEHSPGEWWFAEFLNAVGHRPSPRHRIARRQKSVGYSPENLMWAERPAENKKSPTSARHPDTPYLNIEEAAAYTDLAVGTLYNMVSKGRLKKQPGTARALFTTADLDAYLTTKAKRRTPRERKPAGRR